jgi:hypothetical protein
MAKAPAARCTAGAPILTTGTSRTPRAWGVQLLAVRYSLSIEMAATVAALALGGPNG